MPYTTNPRLPKIRMDAVVLLRKGWSTREVSRHLGFNQSTIVRWYQRSLRHRVGLTAMTENLGWMYWCRGLTLERWRSECQLVEERFSLFRAFAEPPFLGFRGVVARSGFEYRVMAAAEMDFYPKYQPWAFVTPSVAGAREDGKLSINLAWDGEVSRFVDVIEVVVLYIEGAHQPTADVA